MPRSHQGKGIATEAAAAWRDYAFDTLAMERIVSMVSESNVASRRVAEKLGMTVEREAMWGGLPHLMYSMHPDQREVLAVPRRIACGAARPVSYELSCLAAIACRITSRVRSPAGSSLTTILPSTRSPKIGAKWLAPSSITRSTS